MIKTKKAYHVLDDKELWEKDGPDFFHSIWITNNFKCRNMGMKEAFNNSKCISGCIIDDSIKDSLIFTFFDTVQYGLDEDQFVEISYETLLECCCEEVEIVYCDENQKNKGD